MFEIQESKKKFTQIESMDKPTSQLQNNKTTRKATTMNTNWRTKLSIFRVSICLCLLLLLHSTATVAQLRPWVKSEFPKTDFSKSIINTEEIVSGGPPRDGIPAIDEPTFLAANEATEWLNPKEPVISVELNGKARAYPLQVLIWHEIVNDNFDGRPIVVTFCPLCNSSLTFDRNLDGEILDFGVTGRLRHSDMIMYDRQTETWWQQITGEGLIGEHAGRQLDRIDSHIVSFQSFLDSWPDGLVLAKETGHVRQYGENPYRGYDHIDNNPFLFKDDTYPRLPAMERVVIVSLNGMHRLYPFTKLQGAPVINDHFNGVPIVVLSKHDTHSVLDEITIIESRIIPSATAFRRHVGELVLTFSWQGEQIVDHETRSSWNIFGQAIDGQLKGEQLTVISKGNHFAFSWLAFYPESEIYENWQ